MLISIDDYDRNERNALKYLPNRAIQGFQPVTFGSLNYPCHACEEEEIIRYIDTMHELKNAKYFTPAYSYSVEEANLITKVCDQVVELTKQWPGGPIRPWMSPLAAMTLFRAISAIGCHSGKRTLSVFEVGPGSGYLGAFLINAGHRYASMDNTQAFYL